MKDVDRAALSVYRANRSDLQHTYIYVHSTLEGISTYLDYLAESSATGKDAGTGNRRSLMFQPLV